MTDKTLEQEEVLYEFDAQRYSLSGKPLGTDRVLIVRTEDGRSRFTTRELDGSLAIGQLQLGAAAAEEILRLKAAATARDKEVVGLREEVSRLMTKNIGLTGYDERRKWEEPVINEMEAEIATLRARVAELEGMVPKWCGVQGLDRLRALGWSVAARNWQDKPPMWLMVPPIPLPEGE